MKPEFKVKVGTLVLVTTTGISWEVEALEAEFNPFNDRVETTVFLRNFADHDMKHKADLSGMFRSWKSENFVLVQPREESNEPQI